MEQITIKEIAQMCGVGVSTVSRAINNHPDISDETRLCSDKKLLDSGKEFTCIFTASDRMAVGACKALFDAGKRIPANCSVAGFDGLEYAAYYEPSTTTIRQPGKEMAEATISLLFDLINHEQTEKRRIFSADLIIGKSTATL